MKYIHIYIYIYIYIYILYEILLHIVINYNYFNFFKGFSLSRKNL